MMTLRRSLERGRAELGWLRSFHSFSFADYHDPEHMHFGNLRVINEDLIAAGTGFGMHSHRDMEIVTYLLSGELTHKDSMGTGEASAGGVIGAGDVQRMSAGHGVRHSEFNHGAVPTHLLQIWLHPRQWGIEPSYEQKHFSPQSKRGRLCLVASGRGEPEAVTLHANAAIYAGLFDQGESASLDLGPDRLAYVHVVRGRLSVNDQTLDAGDALQLSSHSRLDLRHVSADPEAEVLVFDLAPLAPPAA